MRKRVRSDDFRRGVGYFNDEEIGPRQDTDELAELETVLAFTRQLDPPLHALRGRGDDLGRQDSAERKGIDRIAQVLRERDLECARYFDEFVPRKLELRLAGPVMTSEDGTDDGGIAVGLLRRLGIDALSHSLCSLALGGYALPRRRPVLRSARQRSTCRTTVSWRRPAQQDRWICGEPGMLRESSPPRPLRAAAERSCRFAGNRATSLRGSGTSRDRNAGAPLRAR